MECSVRTEVVLFRNVSRLVIVPFESLIYFKQEEVKLKEEKVFTQRKKIRYLNCNPRLATTYSFHW